MGLHIVTVIDEASDDRHIGSVVVNGPQEAAIAVARFEAAIGGWLADFRIIESPADQIDDVVAVLAEGANP